MGLIHHLRRLLRRNRDRPEDDGPTREERQRARAEAEAVKAEAAAHIQQFPRIPPTGI